MSDIFGTRRANALDPRRAAPFFGLTYMTARAAELTALYAALGIAHKDLEVAESSAVDNPPTQAQFAMVLSNGLEGVSPESVRCMIAIIAGTGIDAWQTPAREALTQRLTPAVFTQSMREQEFAKVNLSMPKFKVRQSRELLKQLEVYGLTRLATGDYTEISPNGIGSVGAVLHEAVVTVDEGGTEAAAATAVVLARGAFMRDEKAPKDVKVDHPFAFALIHKSTRAPLFLGVVGDPR
jgi:hypothetical protein